MGNGCKASNTMKRKRLKGKKEELTTIWHLASRSEAEMGLVGLELKRKTERSPFYKGVFDGVIWETSFLSSIRSENWRIGH